MEVKGNLFMSILLCFHPRNWGWRSVKYWKLLWQNMVSWTSSS